MVEMIVEDGGITGSVPSGRETGSPVGITAAESTEA
ncbi:hypothetical protein Tco_0640939, partial [Tanacetum coccineum]